MTKKRQKKGQARIWKGRYRKGRSKAIRQQANQAMMALESGRALEDDPAGDGFVYVMRLGIGNLYKIGCSTDVNKRLKALMAANPELTLTFAIRVASRRAAERALHTKFSEKRTAGELFQLDESDLAAIAACFPNAETMLDRSRLSVEEKPKRGDGQRACSHCGTTFTPAKGYWRLCPSCIKGSRNKTIGGWSRWRNLRTETHLHGEG